jgi:hypothetical protein
MLLVLANITLVPLEAGNFGKIDHAMYITSIYKCA